MGWKLHCFQVDGEVLAGDVLAEGCVGDAVVLGEHVEGFPGAGAGGEVSPVDVERVGAGVVLFVFEDLVDQEGDVAVDGLAVAEGLEASDVGVVGQGAEESCVHDVVSTKLRREVELGCVGGGCAEDA